MEGSSAGRAPVETLRAAAAGALILSKFGCVWDMVPSPS